MNSNQVLNTNKVIPTYEKITRDKVKEIASIISKSSLTGRKTYYEVIFLVETALNIRISNIDTQTCRSNITRAISMAAGCSIGGVKAGYNFDKCEKK